VLRARLSFAIETENKQHIKKKSFHFREIALKDSLSIIKQYTLFYRLFGYMLFISIASLILMLSRSSVVRCFSPAFQSAGKRRSCHPRYFSPSPNLIRFSSSQTSTNSGPGVVSTTRFSSSTADKSFESTQLGKKGAHLFDGLDVYSVKAKGDDHPLAVYGIQSTDPVQYKEDPSLRPILLLHGRTWSSVPVYHLMGGPTHRARGDESRSLMEALLEHGLVPYCMDFRGFGGTAKDDTGCVEPLRCVRDTESVLEWIAERHGFDADLIDANKTKAELPALLGWSQGALVAQLTAQLKRTALSKLILYGSIYDPLHRYPRDPLYVNLNPDPAKVREPRLNTFDDAIEDFTIEGTIPPEPACHFGTAALVSDPIKASWRHLYQFNNCDPARIHVPTLVVAGDQDPYAPLHIQQELFCNLGRGSDRTWSILADSDHAVHLLDGRHRLTSIVVSFIQNSKRKEQGPYY
jgi:pimeloyl-ACP methyl ester carboxylesterase